MQTWQLKHGPDKRGVDTERVACRRVVGLGLQGSTFLQAAQRLSEKESRIYGLLNECQRAIVSQTTQTRTVKLVCLRLKTIVSVERGWQSGDALV